MNKKYWYVATDWYKAYTDMYSGVALMLVKHGDRELLHEWDKLRATFNEPVTGR